MHKLPVFEVNIAIVALILSCAGSEILAAAPALAAQPAPGAKPADGARHEPDIPYDELKGHVGERVIVNTKFKTTRVGTLTKVSNMELTLSVDTSDGPSELTIPHETVATVSLAPTPPPKK
jgi:small nuclear ribonucleoprotein (snRNP)-like protein